jgi:hypothetical protein
MPYIFPSLSQIKVLLSNESVKYITDNEESM